MTKTPEELTEEWKAGKLEKDKDYYIEIMNDDVFIDFYGQLYDDCHYPQNLGFDNISDNIIKRILAPVPTYGEYKAMQEELAEFKRSITSYIGKPIDYDIACEIVNKLLDDKKKLKKELSEHRENCCCLENEKLQLDNNKLEEEISELLTDNKKMQDQIADASKTIEALEDEIAELKEENKQLEEDTGYGWYTAGIESDKNDKLRDLLRECLAHLSLGEIGASVTPINILLTRINAALNETQANPVDSIKIQESEE